MELRGLRDHNGLKGAWGRSMKVEQSPQVGSERLEEGSQRSLERSWRVLGGLNGVRKVWERSMRVQGVLGGSDRAGEARGGGAALSVFLGGVRRV